mmetsp:Transcript_33794/g.76421  ORF Transcript_33794/g.76421 Transcript_33794/m.76421 type:complete len:276 (+) Transcript_33794:106-933(+)
MARSGPAHEISLGCLQRTLCQVGVEAAVILIPLQVFPLNEGLDPLLDEGRCRQEAVGQLPGRLSDQLVVLQHLARLHDAHDGGLDEVPPVLLHGGGHCKLRHKNRGLLGRDERHLDPLQLGRVVRVEGEAVRLRNVLSLGGLVQDPVLGRAEGDEVAAELLRGDAELLERLVRDGFGAARVEAHEDAHLVGGHVQVVPHPAARAAPPKVGLEVRRPQPRLPRKLAPRMFSEVKVFEGAVRGDDLRGELAGWVRGGRPVRHGQHRHLQLNVSEPRR